MRNVRFFIDFGVKPRNSYDCICQSYGHCHSRPCCQYNDENQRRAIKRDIYEVADLIIQTMQNLDLGQITNLAHRRNTWVNCTAEEFGLFIIRRNEANLQNNIKNIRPQVIRDDGYHTGPIVVDTPLSPTVAIARVDSRNQEFRFSAAEFELDHNPTDIIVRRKKKAKRFHIFFVLNGVTYDLPKGAHIRPKTDGWYFIEEGEKYVASSPFDKREEAVYYVETNGWKVIK